MNHLNSILIEGNLVRDPLFTVTPQGTAWCGFTIASTRYYKTDSGTEQDVSFFDIETAAKLAQSCKEHGTKGGGVRVVGRLKQTRWIDADGKAHSIVCIVAEHVEFRSMTTPAESPMYEQQDGEHEPVEAEDEKYAL